MEISIQNQKIQLSSLRICLLTFRPHLQEGWTDLPSSHQEGRVVLDLEVPAATEEEQAAPGRCPEGDSLCLAKRHSSAPSTCAGHSITQNPLS